MNWSGICPYIGYPGKGMYTFSWSV